MRISQRAAQMASEINMDSTVKARRSRMARARGDVLADSDVSGDGDRALHLDDMSSPGGYSDAGSGTGTGTSSPPSGLRRRRLMLPVKLTDGTRSNAPATSFEKRFANVRVKAERVAERGRQ